MHIIQVHVQVKPEFIEAFQRATMENAGNSIHESGVARFDVLQQTNDPGHFVLVEVYRTAEDQNKHRETAHYLKWRDAVAEMMAEPRSAMRYTNVFPDDRGWG